MDTRGCHPGTEPEPKHQVLRPAGSRRGDQVPMERPPRRSKGGHQELHLQPHHQALHRRRVFPRATSLHLQDQQRPGADTQARLARAVGFVHPRSRRRRETIRVAVRELHEHLEAAERGGVRLQPRGVDAGEDHGAQERAQHGLSADSRAHRIRPHALAEAGADPADAADAARVSILDPARVHLRVHAARYVAQALAEPSVPQRRHPVPRRDRGTGR